MVYKKILAFSFAIVISMAVFGQRSAAYTSDLVEYQKALSLYTFMHFLYVLKQYSAVLNNAKVDRLSKYFHMLYMFYFIFFMEE